MCEMRRGEKFIEHKFVPEDGDTKCDICASGYIQKQSGARSATKDGRLNKIECDHCASGFWYSSFKKLNVENASPGTSSSPKKLLLVLITHSGRLQAHAWIIGKFGKRGGFL